MVRHVTDPFNGEYGESGGFGNDYSSVPFNPQYKWDYPKSPEVYNEDQQDKKTEGLEDISDEDSPLKE